MLSEAQALPEDPAELRVAAEGLVSLVKSQALRIAKLEHQLAGLRRHRFGPTSESLRQLPLSLEDEEIAAAQPDKVVPPSDPTATAKGVPKRKPLPAHLPRQETLISPGDACAECGGKRKPLGEDVTAELDYLPGRFVVNRIVRPRLACTCFEAICQAPMPSRPIERGRPGPGLLAHVLVAKYGDHHGLAEGGGLRQAIARRDRHVPLQGPHRPEPWRPDAARSEDGSPGCLCRAEPDDPPRHARVATRGLRAAPAAGPHQPSDLCTKVDPPQMEGMMKVLASFILLIVSAFQASAQIASVNFDPPQFTNGQV